MRCPRVPALWLMALLAGAANAQQGSNPDLDIAERLVRDLRFAEAQKALEAAWQWPGNSSVQVRRILELQGICAGTLNQQERATTAFRKLLSLDSKHHLADGYPPRVTTPYYEAKGWIADRGGLSFMQAPPLVVNGKVGSVVAALQADPLAMGRKVRFHARADGGTWRTFVSELVDRRATAAISGDVVEWWAELIGENDMGLAQLGSPGAPLVNGQPRRVPPVVAVPPPAAQPERRGGGSLPAAYALLGVGVVGAGAGSYFAYDSYSARAKVDGATVDGNGLTAGLTQREAFALDAQARQSAVLANALLGAAAAAAATGVALWIWDGQIAVAPAPNGVAVSGVMP